MWGHLVLALALVLMAACGGSPSSQGPAGGDPAGPQPGQGQPGSPDAPADPGEPVYGGTLTVALHGEIDKLDPMQSVTIVGNQVHQNVVETLVTATPTLDGVQPELATDWTISEDGLTYTFHLRQGVKFHNGKDFTSEDVIYSFERMMDPDFPAADRSDMVMVERVEAPDDYTVVFHLEYPFAAFLTNLESLWIFPKGADVDFNQHLIGTGPFKFVEWVSGDRITLERFDEYWEEGKPYLDQVIFRPIPEDATKLVELRTGGINFAGNLPYKDVAAVEQDPNIKVYRELGVVRDHLGFNVTKPPFDNKLVRQAMCWLVDREGIAEAILYGHAQPAQVGIPESHWAFNPGIRDAYGFDPERARQLLEEAGYGDGLRFSLKVSPTYPEEIKMAELFAEAARSIGVDVDIVQLEWSTWIDEVVVNGDFEAEIVLISGGIDPDDFFYQWYHTGEIFNMWRLSLPELDDLMEEGRRVSDQGARAQIYHQIQDILVDEAVTCHIIYRESVMASAANVHGFVMTGREDMDFKTVWISDNR